MRLLKYDIYDYFGSERLYLGFDKSNLVFVFVGSTHHVNREFPRPSLYIDALFCVDDERLFSKFLQKLCDAEKDNYHGFEFNPELFYHFYTTFNEYNARHVDFDATNFSHFLCITPPRNIDI